MVDDLSTGYRDGSMKCFVSFFPKCFMRVLEGSGELA